MAAITSRQLIPNTLGPTAARFFVTEDGFDIEDEDGNIVVRFSGSQMFFESAANGSVQIRIKTNSTNRRIIFSSNSSGTEGQIEGGDDGAFSFFGPTTGDERLLIGADGSLTPETFVELDEVVSEPAAPADGKVRLFALDAGGGKTQLMARFNTGASQQFALEP